MTDDATQQLAPLAPAEPLEPAQDADFLAEVRGEAEAMDVGELPRDGREGRLFRYLRRRGQLAAEAARLRELMGDLIGHLENKVRGLDYLYRSEAEDFARVALGHGKARSVKTPFGVVGFRKSAARVEVMDEARLIEAAESDVDLMGLVRERKEVSRSAVVEHFKTTGQVPPGCEVREEQDNFYIK